MTEYQKTVLFWESKHIVTDAELAEILNSQAVAFAYHSGKIENERITFNDTREIFDHDGVTSYTGDLKTLFEIQNAKHAYDLFLKAFQERRDLDESLIMEFQETLTRGTYDLRRWRMGERPGQYKKHDYVTGRHEIGAAPEDVSEEMAELLKELEDVPPEQTLTAAAYFHAKFENIHPFADGNGRTGRILMNYFLVCRNHPPIVIYEEDRKQYYDALEAWDTEQKLEPLRDFLCSQTEKTWANQIARAGKKDLNREKQNPEITR